MPCMMFEKKWTLCHMVCFQGTSLFMVVRTCPPEPPHLFRKWSRSRPEAYRMGRMNWDLQLGWEWIGMDGNGEDLWSRMNLPHQISNKLELKQFTPTKAPFGTEQDFVIFCMQYPSQERSCLRHQIDCWLVLSKLAKNLISCSPFWYESKWLDHIGPQNGWSNTQKMRNIVELYPRLAPYLSCQNWQDCRRTRPSCSC